MTCVGFSDCPCPKCRQRRLSATDRHPHPDHDPDHCGACRTQELNRYRVAPPAISGRHRP